MNSKERQKKKFQKELKKQQTKNTYRTRCKAYEKEKERKPQQFSEWKE